ncbi:MAG: hypothetical protein KME26_20530 [Oscillatoria princeps RMCB-10]|jgi:hypothetical protein|nr:hypothetical protein [Oscillatoria princeps RMCB-10]
MQRSTSGICQQHLFRPGIAIRQKNHTKKILATVRAEPALRPPEPQPLDKQEGFWRKEK